MRTRRGLLPATATVALQLALPLLLLVAALRCFLAGGHSMLVTNSASGNPNPTPNPTPKPDPSHNPDPNPYPNPSPNPDPNP